MLYRLFPMVIEAAPDDPGGPLHVPRLYQGPSRHDNPEHYGALYASRSPVSAAAEWLRRFRGGGLEDADLVRPDGARMAVASIDDRDLETLLDLDDPASLVARGLRPSGVATRSRARTRPLALGVFRDGYHGFEWWSTVEASWINVTLFAERTRARLRLAAEPEPLTLADPLVLEAADALGIALGR